MSSIASIAQQAFNTELMRQQTIARDPIGAAAALITTPEQAILADQSLSSFIGVAPLSTNPNFAQDFKGSPLTTIPPVGTPFQPITLNGGQGNNFSVLNNVLQADPTKDTQTPGIFPSANPIRLLSTPTNPGVNTSLLPSGIPTVLPQGIGSPTTPIVTPPTAAVGVNPTIATAKAAILAPSNGSNPFDSMPKTAATAAPDNGQTQGGKRSLDDVLTQLLDSDPKGKSTPKPPEVKASKAAPTAIQGLAASTAPKNGGPTTLFGSPINSPTTASQPPVTGLGGALPQTNNGQVTTGINFLDKNPSGKTVSLSGSEFFNITQRLSGKPNNTAKILQQAGLGDLAGSVDAELNKKTLDFSAKQATNPATQDATKK